MHSVSSHLGDQYKHRPQDLPFVSDLEVANSACHWGSACNAGAGMGRFVRDLYTVGRYAIFARPGSKVEMLCELRDMPVGIGEMAGSHFTSLDALAQVLPREHIELVHTGGPGRRLLALLEGEVEAANLLDPELPIAESKGLRKLAQGEFMITFWVPPNPVRGARLVLQGTPARGGRAPARPRAVLPPLGAQPSARPRRELRLVDVRARRADDLRAVHGGDVRAGDRVRQAVGSRRAHHAGPLRGARRPRSRSEPIQLRPGVATCAPCASAASSRRRS
jgi:hypothetical protein